MLNEELQLSNTRPLYIYLLTHDVSYTHSSEKYSQQDLKLIGVELKVRFTKTLRLFAPERKGRP